MTVVAQKKGTKAKFTDGIWATEIPQKAGWVRLDNESQPEKVIPKKVIDMAESQKASLDSPVVVKKNAAAAKPKRPPRKKKVDGDTAQNNG